ncbi:right-handed parallel beta-helix repeat-containing protein [Roseibacillus ishigakijimensis]|uniref:Right-handed parallel beta-helix repeat-containing protein n=1 Tax=Roseibacillus ishigakijimensis TaxID=454146 RepID=A0A934VGG8_9BACT|nr:right-handed parallel beta-helix repeat-containing protein [Roseibacillus ishigakijimensis]MBK1832848.1 right-handed parallel beta-helix repeat-containing protein [Roseibacillus ishigakijimensis]
MKFLTSCLLLSLLTCPAHELFLSPQGDDRHPGTREQPLATLAGAARALQEAPVGEEAITIWIQGGHYPVSETAVFGPGLAGTAENPIRFRAVAGEVPVFDAGLTLPLSEAQPVEKEEELAKLHPTARGQVYSLPVTDKGLHQALAKRGMRCSLDGKMMTVATYPNVGFGHIDRVLAKGAVYAQGRTQGAPPRWTLDQPIGGKFTLLDKDLSAWEKELQDRRVALVTGYLSHDWYRETHPIANIQEGVIQLADSSRYGVLGGKAVPRRLRVTNLLCELDQPGEFYYDEPTARLYFLPPRPLSAGSRLSIWQGPAIVETRGACRLSLEGLVFEGVGQGKALVSISGSHDVVLAGCTIRNSTRPGVIIEGGQSCGLLSCDLYDLPHHLTLSGGTVKTLTPSGHFAKNCHFTQIEAADFYGRVSIRGVGQVFRNNLIHHFPGQVVVFGDCDHLIERNELFNIGFEEGDGGAIYSGASRWSWGNVIQHNFLHHLMCLPEAHPRGGVYPDDGDQGETIAENIFYKAAHRAVLINGGAGHRVRGNLFLQGYIGIYNTEAYAERGYRDIARYEKGELKRGDKGDAIWRTERVVGDEGWNKEPWISRYPLFAKIMNQERMRFYPIECEFVDNRFAGNWRNIEYRTGSGEKGVKDIAEVPFIKSEGNEEVPLSLFMNPANLDFRPRAGAGLSMPAIPFTEIGLYRDSYRRTAPDPSSYRRAVQAEFADRPSYDPDARYNPRTVNEEIYFNSGRLLEKLAGFLH